MDSNEILNGITQQQLMMMQQQQMYSQQQQQMGNSYLQPGAVGSMLAAGGGGMASPGNFTPQNVGFGGAGMRGQMMMQQQQQGGFNPGFAGMSGAMHIGAPLAGLGAFMHMPNNPFINPLAPFSHTAGAGTQAFGRALLPGFQHGTPAARVPMMGASGNWANMWRGAYASNTAAIGGRLGGFGASSGAAGGLRGLGHVAGRGLFATARIGAGVAGSLALPLLAAQAAIAPLQGMYEGGASSRQFQGQMGMLGNYLSPTGGTGGFGQGFSRGDVAQSQESLRGFSRNFFPGGSEQGNLDQIMGIGGQLVAQKTITRSSSATQFADQLKKELRTLKEISKVTRTTLEEAAPILEELNRAGFGNTEQKVSQLLREKGVSRRAGLSAGEMSAVREIGGQAGLQATGSYGGARAGAIGAGRVLDVFETGVTSGVLDRDLVDSLGGTKQVATNTFRAGMAVVTNMSKKDLATVYQGVFGEAMGGRDPETARRMLMARPGAALASFLDVNDPAELIKEARGQWATQQQKNLGWAAQNLGIGDPQYQALLNQVQAGSGQIQGAISSSNMNMANQANYQEALGQQRSAFGRGRVAAGGAISRAWHGFWGSTGGAGRRIERRGGDWWRRNLGGQGYTPPSPTTITQDALANVRGGGVGGVGDDQFDTGSDFMGGVFGTEGIESRVERSSVLRGLGRQAWNEEDLGIQGWSNTWGGQFNYTGSDVSKATRALSDLAGQRKTGGDAFGAEAFGAGPSTTGQTMGAMPAGTFGAGGNLDGILARLKGSLDRFGSDPSAKSYSRTIDKYLQGTTYSRDRMMAGRTDPDFQKVMGFIEKRADADPRIQRALDKEGAGMQTLFVEAGMDSGTIGASGLLAKGTQASFLAESEYGSMGGIRAYVESFATMWQPKGSEITNADYRRFQEGTAGASTRARVWGERRDVMKSAGLVPGEKGNEAAKPYLAALEKLNLAVSKGDIEGEKTALADMRSALELGAGTFQQYGNTEAIDWLLQMSRDASSNKKTRQLMATRSANQRYVRIARSRQASAGRMSADASLGASHQTAIDMFSGGKTVGTVDEFGGFVRAALLASLADSSDEGAGISDKEIQHLSTQWKVPQKTLDWVRGGGDLSVGGGKTITGKSTEADRIAQLKAHPGLLMGGGATGGQSGLSGGKEPGATFASFAQQVTELARLVENIKNSP